jgi:uncharacterized protein YvpB
VFFISASLATVSLYIPSSYTVYANAATSPSITSIESGRTENAPTLKSVEIETQALVEETEETMPDETVVVLSKEVGPEVYEESALARTVPFYSQFTDISAPEWRKIGCGITSLAMLIDFYKPAVAVDVLLNEGIESGAYVNDAGWSHSGLIALAKDYGLTGEARYLTGESMADAFANLKQAVEEGPVMVSVHYTFEPTNPIPHLVVVTDIDEQGVHYNDPAEKSGDGVITTEKFQNSWKKRYIEIRPTT